MKPKLIFPIADTHIGSTTGLHPDVVNKNGQWVSLDEAGGWFYKHNNHYFLNSKQKALWGHYKNGINAIANYRKYIDADLLLLIKGDAIDGDHHGTHQLTTRSELEQVKVHVELMKWTKEQLGFNSETDKLMYEEGTESHTKDHEYYIAEQLQAHQFKDGHYCTPFIELEIYGKLIWSFHHGVSAGYSTNRGQALVGYLRKVFFARKAEGKPVPDCILTAHTHMPDRQVFRYENQEIHGIIVPPFQDKTRYVSKIATAIVQNTKVGFSPLVIYPNGKIDILEPYLLSTPLGERLVW